MASMGTTQNEPVMTLGDFREITADLPDYVPLWAVVRDQDNPDDFGPSVPLYDADVHQSPPPCVVRLYVEGLA